MRMPMQRPKMIGPSALNLASISCESPELWLEKRNVLNELSHSIRTSHTTRQVAHPSAFSRTRSAGAERTLHYFLNRKIDM
jgi:hypothetical protein